MNESISAATALSALGTICAVIFGYVAFQRTRGKDAEADGKSGGVILTEIGYIKAGVDDIKTEQRSQRKLNEQLIARLTAVEMSAREAQRRLERVENEK